MSKQTAHEFIKNYYDVEKNNVVCERKSFTRFCEAMPLGLDREQIENAYTAFSGLPPRYNKNLGGIDPWRTEQYKNKANLIVDTLTHDPTSFTDLYNAAFGAYNTESTDSLRKCFKAMAATGVIGCMEIKTCGKCHIRLYYLND